ncbi:MAG TPA: hypothetical protein DDW94_02595 [Deltaproteobacteria bacterium]|nr:MAG: hypothetical protein A2Z79_09250 [Deltaproteobacteria bacterium GWA2_55_82]OGQ64647.1 MAG: hypothetical protein A3I81_11520 [Deltaproteobacteria bacterium RIFCSPLOWO2_02_FULL_55_12]OIJ73747.1 MAG: hypothetical protein A2V21_305385 [Deltaproteobacteria bacterium GWC2_55_46]HBG45855.1 hypothetical protein [Deltaproteobacteria bacterium]HCY09726.1 hypothetical protein [Deltaproteobacteria bacterium]
MLRPVAIASTGIYASLKLLDTTAHNVANANTDGFKSRKVSFNEAGEGGVFTTTSKDLEPGSRYYLDGMAYEASNVDIASETISLMTARHVLSLNAAVLKTSVEMEESLLDTFA